MLKRIIAFVLSLALLFTLCSCQSGNENASSNESKLDSSNIVNASSEDTSSIVSDTTESETQDSASSDTDSERVSTSSNASSGNTTSATTTSINIPAAETTNGEEDPKINNSSRLPGQPYDTESFNPQNMKSKGIDVSKWQGRIDWSLVKKAGIEFAIVRIGYRAENGKIYKDENADYNIQQALKQGLLVGIYFFSTAVNTYEAKQDALWTAEQIKGYSISYPVVFDCEGFSDAKSRMNGLTPKQRTDNAVAFLEEIKAAGYEPMFYKSYGEWDIERLEKSYKIWVPQYNLNMSNPEEISYSGKCNMWQYTDNGRVDGIGPVVDLNISYFKPSKASPKDKNATPKEAKVPESFDEMEFTKVEEKVTAKDEVYLREGPSTSFKKIAIFRNGETLTRIGVNDKGWSKLYYKGQIVYAVTSYLTTDLSYKNVETKVDIVEGNTFKPQSDSVTAKDTVNLREKPTTNSAVLGTIYNGDIVIRTAISDKGWSRILYGGKTAYAVTSFLTTDLLEASSEPSTEPDIEEKNILVTAKIEVNLRDKPTTEQSKVVYLLKNGEYVKCTGVYSNGWSRLEYKGKTVYAVTSFLEEKSE